MQAKVNKVIIGLIFLRCTLQLPTKEYSTFTYLAIPFIYLIDSQHNHTSMSYLKDWLLKYNKFDNPQMTVANHNKNIKVVA